MNFRDRAWVSFRVSSTRVVRLSLTPGISPNCFINWASVSVLLTLALTR